MRLPYGSHGDEQNNRATTDDTGVPVAMTDNSEQTLTLSVDEAAGLLGISRGLAYELVHRGELRAIRLGRRILVPRHVIESLVNQPGNAA
jgi:excisionase family DNA binding protein